MKSFFIWTFKKKVLLNKSHLKKYVEFKFEKEKKYQMEISVMR